MNVTIRQQTDDVVVLERSDHRRASLGPQRNNSHPEFGTQFDEPVEQLRRVKSLHDHGDRVPAVSNPAARPFPTAQVRQRDDRALSRIERCDEVLVSILSERPSHGTFRHGRQPETFNPVAGVRVKRLLDSSTEPQAAQRGVDTLKVSLDHGPSFRAREVGTQAGRRGEPSGHGAGQESRRERSGLVGIRSDAAHELIGVPARIGEVAPTRIVRSLRILVAPHAALRSDIGVAARPVTACGVGYSCGDVLFERLGGSADASDASRSERQ